MCKVIAERRNHRGIIRAELEAREVDRNPTGSGCRVQRIAQRAVGADAAGHHQVRKAGVIQRPRRLAHQRFDNSLLHTARDVGAPLPIGAQARRLARLETR